MVKLWPWMPGQTRRMKVKVRPLKLEGLSMEEEEEEGEDGGERMVFVIKMKWKGPRSGFVLPFYRGQRNYSSAKPLLKEGGSSVVAWKKEEEQEGEEDEFENVCDFWIGTKDESFAPWDVSFVFLCGKDGTCKDKMDILGNVSMNIAELALKRDSHVEKKLPISLEIGGVTSQATVLMQLSFAEVRNSQDPSGIAQNPAELDDKDGNFTTGKGVTASSRKKKGYELDESSSSSSALSDSDGTGGGTQVEDSGTKGSDGIGGLSWWKRRKKRRLMSKRMKGEPLIGKTSRSSPYNDGHVGSDLSDLDGCCFEQREQEGCIASDEWEVKELESRDGKAKLKANVFFASFDQRSERAAGEGACTAIVAVIADWLHSNQEFMPTASQFNGLITAGSLEWRKLCVNETYMNSFPDNHFDLETVLKANLRPLTILHERSFTGVFSPEKFENLEGAMSFDDIWNQISCSNTEDHDQKIYIVSWNDHFFVLKVDTDAYYIIDSLGERLFEGCSQAYILKFDDSSLMYGTVDKEGVNSKEMAGKENGKDDQDSEEDVICKGKECCREFIKRFLAAIPLGDLEEQEKKGRTVSTFTLLQRLQIDFHYCSPLSASSSSSSSQRSSTSSLF